MKEWIINCFNFLGRKKVLVNVIVVMNFWQANAFSVIFPTWFLIYDHVLWLIKFCSYPCKQQGQAAHGYAGNHGHDLLPLLACIPEGQSVGIHHHLIGDDFQPSGNKYGVKIKGKLCLSFSFSFGDGFGVLEI